jgi:hypothetical protein
MIILRKQKLVVLLLILASCNRDPEIIPDKAGTCTIKEIRVGSWGKYTYTFDSENRPVQCVFTDWDNVKEIDYFRYENGKLAEVLIFYDKVKRYPDAKETYTETPWAVTYSRFTQRDEDYIENIRHQYLLDGNGKLTGMQEYLVDNGLAIPGTYWQYETDNDGNITTERELMRGVLQYTTTYTYDEKKNYELTLPEATVLKFGKNNKVKEERRDWDNNVVSKVTWGYKYTPEGYPATAGENGSPYYNFAYQCE